MTNNKVIAVIAQKLERSCAIYRSRSVSVIRLKGVVTNVISSHYKNDPLNNKKVINVHYTVN